MIPSSKHVTCTAHNTLGNNQWDIFQTGPDVSTKTGLFPISLTFRREMGGDTVLK